MYKPHTIEQYKIQRFLDETFAMEHFLVSPLSRTSLLLEDETGASGPSIPNRVCVLLKILPAGGWTTPIP